MTPMNLLHIARCNTISEVRKAAKRDPSVKEGTGDSISPVKILMSNIFTRLKLEWNAFQLLLHQKWKNFGAV